MKRTSFTQGDWIALGVGAVLTLTAIILLFVLFERTPISPTAPPTVVTAPAALPANPPVMALALPSGSSNSGMGGMPGAFGSGGMGGPPGMMGGPRMGAPGMGGAGAGAPMSASKGMMMGKPAD